jgi:DNA-damage-inducible protein D
VIVSRITIVSNPEIVVSELPELQQSPRYRATMERLATMKHVSANGVDYWLAREISPVLGYADWDGFEPVLKKAMAACAGIGVPASHHFRQTSVMMKVGKGAEREGVDYFLSKSACSLVAMNGEASKPEIAAAQAYFTVQTHRMEAVDQLAGDRKRLEMREKAKASVKRVSKQAQLAGVRDSMQGVFHDQRYRGLYGKPRREVNLAKGIGEKDNLLDRAGALELSAHDFQMNLAADVIERERIRGEQTAIDKNFAIAKRVRQTMVDERATLPENLSLEPPIKEVAKRVAAAQKQIGQGTQR